MKKLVLFLICMFSLCAYAQETKNTETKTIKKSQGHQVDSLFYDFDVDGHASVLGYVSGCQGAFKIPSYVTFQKRKYKVTHIRRGAFSHCCGITAITIPATVTTIDEGAFVDCTNLQTVTIFGFIDRIPKHAFQYCKSLTQVLIPEGVQYLDEESFGSCSSLQSIEFPSSLYYIGKKAFANCSRLTSIHIPAHVGKIEEDAFIGCYGLKSIDVDDANKIYYASNPTDSIYGFTSKRASHPGGEIAMTQQLVEHLNLPDTLPRNISGRTIIKAVVEKNGWLTNLQIAKSCGRADIDSAVLKAASYLSKYIPANDEEEIVRSYTFIPASFPSIFSMIQNLVNAKAITSPTLTYDTVSLPYIPKTGEVLYSGNIELRPFAYDNPFMPTYTDSIYSWVETISFEKSGDYSKKAMVYRQNDIVKLVWTMEEPTSMALFGQDIPAKDEYFRILDKQTMLKEKDVLYTNDGHLRHNYFEKGQLKRSVLLNMQGDTISIWHQVGGKKDFEYIYNIDDYIQMVDAPDFYGNQKLKFKYNHPIGEEIIEPSINRIEEIKLPASLKVVTEYIHSQHVDAVLHVNFIHKNIVIYVYALVCEDGRVVGDYKVGIKDDTYLQYPSSYKFFLPHSKEEREAIAKQKEKIAQYVLNKFSKQKITFSPGTVDGTATTMPCLIKISVDTSSKNVSIEKPCPYTSSFVPQTEDEWAERIGLDFEVVEQMPEFPGGYEALWRYLSENVKYPVIAQENGIQGRVIVQFVVDKDGSIVDVEVAKSGGDASLDKEAVRVIKAMPKWKPGKNHGDFVRVKYTIPIGFRLQ